jgi:hypothetical protein
MNRQRSNVSLNQAVVTSEEPVGSGGLGAGEMQGVQWFLAVAHEFVGAIPNGVGESDGMGGETQAAIDPKPADGKRTATVFECVDWRGDEFSFAGLDET